MVSRVSELNTRAGDQSGQRRADASGGGASRRARLAATLTRYRDELHDGASAMRRFGFTIRICDMTTKGGGLRREDPEAERFVLRAVATEAER
jgi:hypothetical protein